MKSVLSNCDSQIIEDTWRKVNLRLSNDPEGAITAARSLVESTCKYILDKFSESYSDEDLPKLYKMAANKLSLSPNQHNEQIFKQILSGCSTVIGGFASLRNSYGDAHGKGGKSIAPDQRHAELAVNLAGSIAAFLIKTYEERFRS